MAGRTMTSSGREASWVESCEGIISSSGTKEHHGQLTSTGGELGAREWAQGSEGNVLGHIRRCAVVHPVARHHGGQIDGRQNRLDVVWARSKMDDLEQWNKRASWTANFY
jgi:hypothetical protein